MQPALCFADSVQRSLFDPQHQFTLAAGTTCSDGKSSVTLQSATAAPNQYAATRSMLSADHLQNKVVQVHAVFNAQNVSVGAGLWAGAYDGPKQIALTNTENNPVRGTGANLSRTLTLLVPSHTTRLVYGVMMKGPGTVAVCGLDAYFSPPATPDKAAEPLAMQTMRFALDAVRTYALHAPLIDWETRTQPLLDLAAKGSVDDVYAAMRRLLADLQDGHSFVMPPVTRRRMADRTPLMPSFQKISSDIGLISIPSFTAHAPEALTAFIQTAEQHFAQAPEIRGWIVDLRGDSGGNMWPMLQALKPLLGPNDLGFFENRAGKRSSPWRAGTQNAAEHMTTPDLSHLPVAVLIGPHTASAGEAVAIALKGRPATRFFGTPTHGQTTGNKSFRLPDGGLLAVAAFFELDRTGRRYEGPIEPDEVQVAPDMAQNAAKAWLEQSLNQHPVR
ncbi:S41 family peptidase [Acetobacter orleanensis]|uniref:Tail specific protease domain-containing protein n=1 Tax=Acetobacter orleanensis TaxID=104099 RepID=A0A4Y3TMV3_9PROT|nr:S41 family peptidase [Acetobacter orleanensis]PCD80068.1 hypothetical protein CO710_04245 [Acetobacter orleanensis]GAN68395.1 exported protease/peptidase [Acetobacter orleanensis JCM 7639]GEB82759.1 hypothetical protein AOR01nite_12360 [Acetobacter orleanensis]